VRVPGKGNGYSIFRREKKVTRPLSSSNLEEREEKKGEEEEVCKGLSVLQPIVQMKEMKGSRFNIVTIRGKED